MLIVVGGMIGLGKSSVAEILGNHFNSEVFYESVDDNPILPLFYSESEEEILKNRYPFLLQLYFLNTRFKSIKEALYNDNNVLDRSIYEDWYFAKVNMELGRISELEMNTYEGLLEKTEYNTGIGKVIDKDTQDYYTFANAYKKAFDYKVYVNNGEKDKAEQVIEDIDSTQFNNVLFKEALENVKRIYIVSLP